MNTESFENKASNILSVLGNPFRIRLALALAEQEACVCHLENLLKKRQAYISQHLMVLRKAELLETRRDGKFVYYRLSSTAIIDLIRDAAVIAGIHQDKIPALENQEGLEQCVCPHCGESNEGQNKNVTTLESMITP